MKYENLQIATVTCNAIDSIKRTLKSIEDNNELTMKINNTYGNTQVSIPLSKDSDHLCKKEALIFIDQVRSAYEFELKKLYEELEKL